ncbi:7-carboxy-7-deazaguanine synthase [Alkalimarinus sediminis]|uniref:7-carboxy-7-deazaguanine synthase n=1 Tax=Alkalimarinus sediminis TaxID=1632866 RepID=A0A9E8HRF0_9ALTE|nr:7-carboxy-7-deazaguanine synthase [Alkalimarinus sediminis]UZW75101.1 7-carboxy-7-deazaguanine synthase [Alkalimarinus sediminis]
MSSVNVYRVKEMFYSLQGEGAQSGRASVFCRFSKCNLWTGRERDRADAVCNFCDTDFVGTDGQNGGTFDTPKALAAAIQALWDGGQQTIADTASVANNRVKPYVIFTGGEPLLQLDETLIDEMHLSGFEVGVETNGTRPAPKGIDWLCVSPKADAEVVLTQCDEVKLVYPQPLAPPERFNNIDAQHYFLSPMADPAVITGRDEKKANNMRLATAYCLAHPQWRLTLQMHKILGID